MSPCHPVQSLGTLGWLCTLVAFGIGMTKAQAKSLRTIVTHPYNNRGACMTQSVNCPTLAQDH